jgi:mono/diheme cytochrome c family protein
MMTRAFFIVVLMLVSAVSWASTQGGTLTATTPRRGGNPVAAKVANPVAATAESISAGQKTYRSLCARCHGPTGKGDGGGAGAGGQPADFTDDVWEFGSSDGEIFAAIQQGTSADMESYAERISATEIWNLVNYLRTLKTRGNR